MSGEGGERGRGREKSEGVKERCVCAYMCVLGDGVVVFQTADVFITFNLQEQGADKMFQIHVLPLGLNALGHSANSLSVGCVMPPR